MGVYIFIVAHFSVFVNGSMFGFSEFTGVEMWKNPFYLYIFYRKLNLDRQHKHDKIEVGFKRNLTLRVAGTVNNKNKQMVVLMHQLL